MQNGGEECGEGHVVEMAQAALSLRVFAPAIDVSLAGDCEGVACPALHTHAHSIVCKRGQQSHILPVGQVAQAEPAVDSVAPHTHTPPHELEKCVGEATRDVGDLLAEHRAV